MSLLFTPIDIAGLTLKNRIVMSPMCMYSSDDTGFVKNWHRIHLTSRAVGGVGLIIQEATAVAKIGRITARDLGIWSDEHIDGLAELVGLVHEHGAKIGIQLAHAGRKAEVEGRIVAPSAIAFDENYRVPAEMTHDDIEEAIAQFREAARRAKKAGYDLIEIHGAHGYLINEFLSPLTNKRNDEYGGDAVRRFTFLFRVIQAVKSEWDGPLFVRISARDYHPDGNDVEVYVEYAKRMKELGVHLIDCSSGAVVPAQIHVYPGYQVPFAEKIRREAKIATAAVGLITTPQQAEEILRNERADLVFLGRELLRNPYWPLYAQYALGEEVTAPTQYFRAFKHHWFKSR
jgi:NADPH2 dehydrogenase